jgi:predicted RNA-binding Zn-ribbon protein involved in translation (DUF1610 family)
MRVSDDVLIDLQPADHASSVLPDFLSNWPRPTRAEARSSFFATVSESYSTRGTDSVWKLPYNEGEMRSIYRQERFGFPMRCIEHRTFLMQSGDRAAMKAELKRVQNVFGWQGQTVMPEWMHVSTRSGLRMIPTFVNPIGLAVNTVFWAAMLAMGARAVRVIIERRRRNAGRCASCGYNLAGSTLQRCPECGNELVTLDHAMKKASS